MTLRTRGELTMDLQVLARIFHEWVAPAPGVDAVYLFGSRVRGDNRQDSDVDVRLFLNRWDGDNETARWWDEQNETLFADLKARLPGILKLHADTDDAADPSIREGARAPVLTVGRVICVWTPPKRA